MSVNPMSMLLDTSVIVAAYMSKTVRSVVVALSRNIIVGYPGVYLWLDLDRSSLPASVKRGVYSWAVENLEDLGSLSDKEESHAFGRYGRWVRDIGKMDVAIAYLAIARGYILATGDLGQFRFYESVYASRNPKSPLKAMFIPVRWLA